jgi:hypothetical protein
MVQNTYSSAEVFDQYRQVKELEAANPNADLLDQIVAMFEHENRTRRQVSILKNRLIPSQFAGKCSYRRILCAPKEKLIWPTKQTVG